MQYFTGIIMQLRDDTRADTTTYNRKPRNLLDYVYEKSTDDDFLQLLAKHHGNIREVLASNIECEEIRNAKFVIALNGFETDLLKIAKLCWQIDLEETARLNDIEKSRERLGQHSAKDINSWAASFYNMARKYDRYFDMRNRLKRLNGRPFFLGLYFNPFRNNVEQTNEENVFRVVASFNLHQEFFKNFLNTFYLDGIEGEQFLGQSFSEVSSEYERINNIISEASKNIPKSSREYSFKNIEAKFKLLEKMLEKYPTTLYSATSNILNYMETEKAAP
jgi:hypothetical protein